ncbi:MAG: rhamnulokinase [Candidatus Spyradocola sp.]|jgi:rhamnulokinase
MNATFLAMDLGASSGRAMLGTLANGRLELSELHRFSNDPVRLAGVLQWDLPRLFFETKTALNQAALQGISLAAMGIDTWGVDYGLLDARGRLLSDPVNYRDERTVGMMEKAFSVVSEEEIYRRTGLARLSFNTLYQLYSQVLEGDARLELAQDLLFMPDLLGYLLTGVKGCEYTIASTSQMLSPYTRSWDKELLQKLGIPDRLLLPVEEPGKIRGTLLPELARETGAGPVPLVAVAGHDTASAVAAVPASDEDFAYISSGTWSLVGVETREPIISPEAKAFNLTNEGGVDGTYRVLKNVMGLWIIQECRREWERRGMRLTFPQIVEEATRAPAFAALFDPDGEEFLTPGDMPEKIAAACRRTGQRAPESVGETARAVYESLALCYRHTVEALERARGRAVTALHIVGGGSNNEMLNRFTADALGIPVLAGPSEATAIGNLLLQARALGLVGDIWEMRRIVAASFGVRCIDPGDRAPWDEAYKRYLEIVGR